jgi:Domain of unknown function (DUF4926)
MAAPEVLLRWRGIAGCFREDSIMADVGEQTKMLPLTTAGQSGEAGCLGVDEPKPRDCTGGHSARTTTEAPRHREVIETTLNFLIVRGTLLGVPVSVVEALRSFREIGPQVYNRLGAAMGAKKQAKSEPPSLLDVVALLTDPPEHGLGRGQVGTVLEQLDDRTSLVEFSDDQGQAYALVPCPWRDLLVLRYVPEAA